MTWAFRLFWCRPDACTTNSALVSLFPPAPSLQRRGPAPSRLTAPGCGLRVPQQALAPRKLACFPRGNA